MMTAIYKKDKLNRVVVSNMFCFHPYLGKIPILTNILQRGWFNHHLVKLGGFLREVMVSDFLNTFKVW